jgi:hypothetical protein
MASYEIRIDASSPKSIRSLFAICSGLRWLPGDADLADVDDGVGAEQAERGALADGGAERLGAADVDGDPRHQGSFRQMGQVRRLARRSQRSWVRAVVSW